MSSLIPDHLMQLWGGTEATFGAGGAASPATGDAFDHLNFDPGPMGGPEIIPNLEKTGSRGYGIPVQGSHVPRSPKVGVYAKGSGVATTPVDFAFLFKAAGFTETVGGADVSYARTLIPATSAWLWSASANGEVGFSYAGVVVNEIKITAEDLAKFEFSLEAAKVSAFYKTTLNGAVSIGGGSLTLAADHGCVLPTGGAPLYAKIDSEEVKITAISGNTATLSAVLTANHSDGATVTASVPARTVSSQLPVSVANCLFDINAGASELTVLKWEATIKTGVRLLEKEAHNAFRTGFVGERPGEDAVRLNADFYYTVTAGTAKLHQKFANKTSASVRGSVGESAGNIIRINATSAYIVEPPTAPEIDNGPRQGSVVFGGYGSTGADVSIVTL